jgi:hypothetical protein
VENARFILKALLLFSHAINLRPKSSFSFLILVERNLVLGGIFNAYFLVKAYHYETPFIPVETNQLN